MNKILFWSLSIFTLVLLASCGGGGGGGSSSDTTAPAISQVSVSNTGTNQLTLNVTATDNTGVTGYCFKTLTTPPLASDACFQTVSNYTITLPQTTAIYAWAKDAAGNISTSVTAGCSAEGLRASQNSTLPTVCVSTSLGQYVLELESTKAPKTTANFLKYVNDGYYSQTVFHRVMATFMVQGGGFTGVPIGASNAKAGTVYPVIDLEAPVSTGLSNTTGTIAMARTSVPKSATSQFFINVVDNSSFLDTTGGGYAVFGRVISGMDSTINEIKKIEVQSNGSELSQPKIPPAITWAYALK
jgi:peptidyl-prolyl cis-trans isomerase A (cyclophilin A)